VLLHGIGTFMFFLVQFIPTLKTPVVGEPSYTTGLDKVFDLVLGWFQFKSICTMNQHTKY
jgi:hypothetical protein